LVAVLVKLFVVLLNLVFNPLVNYQVGVPPKLSGGFALQVEGPISPQPLAVKGPIVIVPLDYPAALQLLPSRPLLALVSAHHFENLSFL